MQDLLLPHQKCMQQVLPYMSAGVSSFIRFYCFSISTQDHQLFGSKDCSKVAFGCCVVASWCLLSIPAHPGSRLWSCLEIQGGTASVRGRDVRCPGNKPLEFRAAWFEMRTVPR